MSARAKRQRQDRPEGNPLSALIRDRFLANAGASVIYDGVIDTDDTDGEGWAQLLALIIGGELGLLLKQFPEHAERVNRMLALARVPFVLLPRSANDH